MVSNSRIQAQGLFAREAISKDTFITPCRGRRQKDLKKDATRIALRLNLRRSYSGKVSEDDRIMAAEIKAGAYIVPVGVAQYANHSCEPNACFKAWKNWRGRIMVSIVALTDIAPQDEIVVDYGNENHSFRCNCGKPNCRSNNKKRPRIEPRRWSKRPSIVSNSV